MRERLTYANVMASIACSPRSRDGTAYAANTVGSGDIVDGEVKSADIGNNEIGSADVKDGSLNTFDVHSFLGEDVVDGTLTGADLQDNSIGVADIGSGQVAGDEVANDSLLQSDIRAEAVTSDEVLDNALIGTDVMDGSLKDEDIGEIAIRDVEVNVGTVPAQSCTSVAMPVLGNPDGDHLIITPYFAAGLYGSFTEDLFPVATPAIWKPGWPSLRPIPLPPRPRRAHAVAVAQVNDINAHGTIAGNVYGLSAPGYTALQRVYPTLWKCQFRR